MKIALDKMVEIGRRFDARGWVPATSGNFSFRDDDGFWITASGQHKGRLDATRFVRVDLEGDVTERGFDAARPSAETSIHAALYRRFAEAGCILHVHTLSSCLVSRFETGEGLGAVPLPNLEILKAFDLWTEAPNVGIDVFDNHLDVPRIAAEVADHYDDVEPKVPGFLIRDHGLTAWGGTFSGAEYAVEAFEQLFTWMVEARRLGLSVR